jgi:acyl carrier protein
LEENAALLTVELVMEIEEAFDISIPGDQASEMLTVGDVYESRSRTDIWNALQLIAAEQLGVDRSMVEPHARFVQDLGAN